MPNIEIISLRLNVDKDEDRVLFETIKSLSDAGKRNEFLKQSLLECLTKGGAGRRTTARQAKKQLQGSPEPPVREAVPESPGLKQAVGSPVLPGRSSDGTVLGEAVDGSQDHDAGGKEAAGLVASFVH